MLNYNNTPLAECEGFTPLQMHKMIYFPFDEACPIKIKLPDKEMLINKSPIFKIILETMAYLMSDNIKLTQTGNLPPSIIKEIYSKGFCQDFLKDLLFGLDLPRRMLLKVRDFQTK